jgi:outer membrane protein TolC
MLRRTLPLLLLLNLPGFGGERPLMPPVLTLRRAIDIALAKNPGLRAAEERARQSGERARAARNVGLPRVGFNSSQSGQRANLRTFGLSAPQISLYTPPFAVFDSRIDVTYDIWDPARRIREQAARLDADAGMEDRKEASETLIGDVADAFVAGRYSQEVERTLERHAVLASNLLKLVEDRQSKGLGSVLEVNRADQELRRVRLLQVDAAAATRRSKMSLAQLLNTEARSAFEFSDEGAGEIPVPPVADAVQRALASREAYRALDRRIAAAKAQVEAVRARRLPTVQVHADGGFLGDSPVRGIATWRMYGSLQVPLFRGEQTAEDAEAEAKVRELQAIAEGMRAAIETEVSIASSEVDAAKQKVRLAAQIRELADQELELASKRLAAGITDNLEVVAAQERSLQAEGDAARIESELIRRVCDLYRTMGASDALR